MNIIKEIEDLEELMMTKSNTEKHVQKKHLERNELSESSKKSMVTRIISSIVGLAVLIPCLVLGDWFYFVLITLAMGIACWEILGVAKKRTVVMYLVYFLFVALFTYWPIFKDLIVKGLNGGLQGYFNQLHISIIVTIVGMFLVFFLSVVYKDFTVNDSCFLIAMAILLGFGFQCLLYLRYMPVKGFNLDTTSFKYTVDNTFKPSFLLLYILFSTFLTDAGAYFVGMLFGKNKMNERISPKKTWEGFVGGVIISFVLSSTVGLILAASDFPLTDYLRIDHWYYILLLSIVIPLFATLGDFVFSSIKRHYGIKDYGKLIPGHGGVLDRLDSIIFVAIITAILIFIIREGNKDPLNWDNILI